jgi:hypothetical protein
MQVLGMAVLAALLRGRRLNRGRGGDGSSFPLESEAARLQGASVDGASRIRTADLLGAIRESNSRGRREKCLITSMFAVATLVPVVHGCAGESATSGEKWLKFEPAQSTSGGSSLKRSK